jgi:hypothetical protein
MLTIYAGLAISIGGAVALAYFIIHTTAVNVANKLQQQKIASLEAKLAQR